MMFVAPYRDGSCGIAEASDEASARSLLQSEEAYFHDHDKIVSLRPLSRPFVSRWYFDSRDGDELPEIDRLDGMLSHGVAEEIQEHEYPMILAAHSTCEQEEPLFDTNAGYEHASHVQRGSVRPNGEMGEQSEASIAASSGIGTYTVPTVSTFLILDCRMSVIAVCRRS
jgi:hypothetical protein